MVRYVEGRTQAAGLLSYRPGRRVVSMDGDGFERYSRVTCVSNTNA